MRRDISNGEAYGNDAGFEIVDKVFHQILRTPHGCDVLKSRDETGYFKGGEAYGNDITLDSTQVPATMKLDRTVLQLR